MAQAYDRPTNAEEVVYLLTADDAAGVLSMMTWSYTNGALGTPGPPVDAPTLATWLPLITVLDAVVP